MPARPDLPRPGQRACAHEARHQGRRRDHPVRRPYGCRHGPAQDGLPGPAHADRYLQGQSNIKATCGIDITPRRFPSMIPRSSSSWARATPPASSRSKSAGMTATIEHEAHRVQARRGIDRPVSPGPSGRRHGRLLHQPYERQGAGLSYDDRLDDILGETYGTMVYQEQVMLISVEMCGFSKGESDSRIRKPVARRRSSCSRHGAHWEDGSEETTYDHWMNGAVKNGYTQEIAQKIWDDVLEFASYAFNKSHSAGYAILVMQTAWLKAHYPNEYMAAVLTSYTGKTDKIVHYVSAAATTASPCCRQMSTSRVPSSPGYQGGRALWSRRHPRRGRQAWRRSLSPSASKTALHRPARLWLTAWIRARQTAALSRRSSRQAPLTRRAIRAASS